MKTRVGMDTSREALVLELGEQLNALVSASRALTVEAAAAFHPELPPAAFHITRWLYAFGPAKVSRAAEAVAMDRSATSRLTARLIDFGMVETRPDVADGRSVMLHLTTRGRKKIKEAIAYKGGVFRRRIETWSDADLECCAGLLRRLNDLPRGDAKA